MANYSEEIILAAKLMYLRKVSVKDIATELNLNSRRVVYQWAEKGCWDEMLQHETVEQATARQLIKLVEKPKKTTEDYAEITALGNLLDKLAGIDAKKARATREKAKAAKDDGSGGSKKKGKQASNDLSGITQDQLDEIRNELFFDYQKLWHKNKSQRTRWILKSRQIGATYYFAWEAFEDAVISGDNQVFISASRAQADVFKAYIINFAKKYFEITLKGSDVIKLSNGAELRFVSTNGRTAQGYHGHTYFDEVFWVPQFEKFNTTASAMAAHKKWRKTYFSTPSIKTHSAYSMWSGEKFNESKVKKVDFDLSHKTLVNGAIGPDRVWRNIITVVDAEKAGCTLFDIEELKLEYSSAEFANLFMCIFMEAGQSVFKLADLMAGAVDSAEKWKDFTISAARPFGEKEVWLGYDPARFGDQSTVVVIAPAVGKTNKFRILEKIKLKGNFAYQANRIKDLTEKYNVTQIAIDSTGPGLGVFEEVQAFFPYAKSIHYSLDIKTTLVLKAIDTIESRRIEWDASHTEIAQAFLQIHQKSTAGDLITYAADRNSKTGHADVAWAIMHALSNEALIRNERKGSLSFSN